MSYDITSPANPRIKQTLQLRKPRERRRQGLLIAEGRREIERAIGAGLTLRDLFYSAEAALPPPPTQWAGPRWSVPLALLRRLTYRDDPEGWLAVFDQPGQGPGRLIDAAVAGGVLLVAVGTEKPGNLGAMVRTADAAGAVGVLAAGPAVDVYNPNAIRASTGAVLAVPTVCLDEAEAMSALDRAGVRILAAMVDGDIDLHDSPDEIWRASPGGGGLAVVIGPEDRGLDPAWGELARRSGGAGIRIRMRSRVVDSLNASTSAALMLYEAWRRRDRTEPLP